MPTLELLSPGVYGFERAPARAPEGISPAKAAFVGWTEEGPSNTPIQLRSVEEYTAIFGGLSTLGLVPIGIRAAFETGSERIYVVRVVGAGAVAAWVDVDPTPGPTKWTFSSKGEGIWGNDTTVRIRGNRNYIDRSSSPPAWEKFDVLVIRPAEWDPTIDNAEETFEAVQFDDPTAGDYCPLVLNDIRRPSALVEVTEGAGGTPTGLIGADYADEVIGTAAGSPTFAFTLAHPTVLDDTLRIVAGGAQVDDEAQTAVPALDGITSGPFAITLPTTPVLDGSLRMFYPQVGDQFDDLGSGPFAIGTCNGIDTIFQIAAGALTAPVNKENTVFRIRYAVPAGTSPETLVASAPPGPLDLSTTPLAPASAPFHPGTVSIAVTTVDDGAQVITDDGAGNLVNPIVMPGGGTINYVTGSMTGLVTGSLGGGLTPTSTVVATYDSSAIITKALSTDNMDQAAALAGAVSAGTIALVDSVTNPIQSGVINFTATTPPQNGTSILVDYVRTGIVNSDVAGLLTELGGPAGGAGSVDFETGLMALTTLAAPRAAPATIDADYQSGLVVTDDGLGRLVGDVDASGTNTIDYDTGVGSVTFSSTPISGTSILANYSQLDSYVDYPLTGGVNGSAVSRADISAAALETDKKGIYALDRVEEPLNVVVPDFEGSEFVQWDMVQFAKTRADSRYLLMCFADGTTVPEAIQYVLVTQAWDEKVGAMYYPNIYYNNEDTGRPQLVPVSAFAAGVYAKTANNKNVGKSPGGVEDGALDGENTLGAERRLEKADRDDLYQSRINPVIWSDATGLAIWGVRSLSKETRWRWINARTLHNFLMYATSLKLQWAVFENNGPSLWAKIESALKGYYGSLFRLGYFAGETEEEAFSVKCNATNNNATTVSEGKAIIEIGFAPNSPAEFIIFYLQQPIGQQVELST